MKKILIILFSAIFILGGCANKSLEELAITYPFDVTFDKIDEENKTASFTIDGVPNEEEFSQIPTIIIDSMNALELDGEYSINVYSAIQDKEVDPYYGNTKFKDGELTGDITNITVEQYIGDSE